MPYTPAGKNKMLDAIGVTTVSLHTADPGTTGASEVTGGSPAYARKAITFSAAAAGARTSSSQPVFDVPAGVTVTHVGFWDNGPTLLATDAVTAEAFAAQGTYTVSDADLDLNAA